MPCSRLFKDSRGFQGAFTCGMVLRQAEPCRWENEDPWKLNHPTFRLETLGLDFCGGRVSEFLVETHEPFFFKVCGFEMLRARARGRKQRARATPSIDQWS